MNGMKLLREAESAGVSVTRDGCTLWILAPATKARFIKSIRENEDVVLRDWWAWQAEKILNSIDDPDIRSDLRDVFIECQRIALSADDDTESADMIALGEMLATAIVQGVPVRAGGEVRR